MSQKSSESRTTQDRKLSIFVALSVLPIPLWFMVGSYIRSSYSGFGRMAAAPILLPVLILSVVCLVIGVLKLCQARAQRANYLEPLFITLFGGGVAIERILSWLLA